MQYAMSSFVFAYFANNMLFIFLIKLNLNILIDMKKKFKAIKVFILLVCIGSSLSSCKSGNDDPSPSPGPNPSPSEVPTVDVFSQSGGTNSVTWSEDTIYILRGFVFVNEGQTLTIEAGTVIKGQSGQGSSASALIVARGGKIMAEGTANAPIVFTALSDTITQPNSSSNLPNDANGLWGGVIILGRATNNNKDTGGEVSIEGIPTDETRGQFGGTDDTDNSGVLRYISIRHGGSLIGANNEINGLTLGSVGSGTIIENVEIFSNLDDGIEFFGGTVNVSNLVLTYSGDDGIDIDLGYRGSIQNVLVWHTASTLESSDPRSCEMDGGDGANESEMPFATPNIANLTAVFDNDGATNLNSRSIYFRDNFGGSFYNSVFVGQTGTLDIERRLDREQSSHSRYVAGDIEINNNIFFNLNGVTAVANFGNIFQISDDEDNALQATLRNELTAVNTFVDPSFGSVTNRFTPNAVEITTNLATSLPGSLEDQNYKGAIDPSASQPFFADWTKTWQVLNQ